MVEEEIKRCKIWFYGFPNSQVNCLPGIYTFSFSFHILKVGPSKLWMTSYTIDLYSETPKILSELYCYHIYIYVYTSTDWIASSHYNAIYHWGHIKGVYLLFLSICVCISERERVVWHVALTIVSENCQRAKYIVISSAAACHWMPQTSFVHSHRVQPSESMYIRKCVCLCMCVVPTSNSSAQ